MVNESSVFEPLKFYCIMYDRTGSIEGVDEARLQLCTQKDRQIEAIPPTKAALLQHMKRVYIKVHWYGETLWSQTLCYQALLTLVGPETVIRCKNLFGRHLLNHLSPLQMLGGLSGCLQVLQKYIAMYRALNWKRL